MILFSILPSIYRNILRQEALHIINFIENFSHIDEIVITLDSKILFETNKNYYDFEEVKNILSPSNTAWLGYSRRVRRDILRQSIMQSVSIEYIIEGKHFFTINTFILSTPLFSEVASMSLNNKFLIIDNFYVVAFINDSATMVRLNFSNFEESLIKQIIYESLLPLLIEY